MNDTEYAVRVTFYVTDDPGSEESIAEQAVNALAALLDATSITVDSVDVVPPPPEPKSAEIIEFPRR